jgi:hypothetical protein
LIFDSEGNLYGTTRSGGDISACSSDGCGVVFELSPPSSGTGPWTETVLYTFAGGTDGAQPHAGLIFDSKGNLYGTTFAGGDTSACAGSTTSPPGCGVVFELSPPSGGTRSWSETVLHTFTGGSDGGYPTAGLIFDTGPNSYGCGVAFELSPPSTGVGPWDETVLYSFIGPGVVSDGEYPDASLVLDAKGNLYGTTNGGGLYEALGYGVVFELSPPVGGSGPWTETVLCTFSSATGASPAAGLILDSNGNFYGTTSGGGSTLGGVAFELSLSPAATPSFGVPSGTYSSPQTVTISDMTAGATIYYTTNGTTPTASSIQYAGPIEVSTSETIEAIATASGYSASAVASATYTINISGLSPAATPTFSIPSGTYTSAQAVTISDPTAGAMVYYTTNGTVPNTSSTQYNGAIPVNSSETIKAIAVATGYNNSAVATATYTINIPPPGEWTWMGGSTTIGSTGGRPGVYGTLGTPAAANTPGGRDQSASWTDRSGSLWLFGGGGYDSAGTYGTLGDLWEFNPSTRLWVWMGGSSTLVEEADGNYGATGVYGTLGTPAAGNVPGARGGAASWADMSGNFWLFGGGGYDSTGMSGMLNDLWEFNPSTGLWVWMGGSNTVGSNSGQPGVYGTLGTPAPGNVPGGRWTPTSWTDQSGNLWLFGGLGFDSNGGYGELNDLWEFNLSIREWAWMGGSSTTPSWDGVGYPGVYGTLGIPAPGNVPGGRDGAVGWADSSGNPWLFGGNTEAMESEDLNDLWEFSPSTMEWTWMGGSMNANQPGVHGALGTPAAGNVPGGRAYASSWTDSHGNFWLFGGAWLNDLWAFNPSTREWTWMGGSSTAYQPGVYGTLGAPAAGNVPGGRSVATSWLDSSGNLWLFGGNGEDSAYTLGYLNDLWEYQPSASTTTQAATPTFSVPSGTYSSAQTVTISDTTPGATIYYTTNGTTPTTSSTQYTGAITVGSTKTIEAIATASGYSPSAVATATYIINLPLVVTPSSLNFGIQQLNTTSASHTVTVSNNGTATLTLTAIGIAGTNSSDFNQSNNCPISPSTFAPGASCQVSATFAPTASGPRKSAINVQDSSGDSLFVLLTGVGTAVGLSPASLSFPSQSVGTSGTPQTVTLSNLGSGPMNIWQMALRGANAADFSQSSTCGKTLAAESNCGITVTFTPSAAGTRSASLLISDDGGGSPQSVSLSGVGSGDPPALFDLKRKRER